MKPPPPPCYGFFSEKKFLISKAFQDFKIFRISSNFANLNSCYERNFKISDLKIFRISKFFKFQTFFEFQGQPFPAPLYSVHRMNVLWLPIGFQNLEFQNFEFQNFEFQNFSNFKIFRISKFFKFQGQPFPAPLYSVHRMHVLWLPIEFKNFGFQNSKFFNFKIFRISKFFEFQGQPFPAPLYSVHRMNVLWLLIGFQNFFKNFKN